MWKVMTQMANEERMWRDRDGLCQMRLRLEQDEQWGGVSDQMVTQGAECRKSGRAWLQWAGQRGDRQSFRGVLIKGKKEKQVSGSTGHKWWFYLASRLLICEEKRYRAAHTVVFCGVWDLHTCSPLFSVFHFLSYLTLNMYIFIVI